MRAATPNKPAATLLKPADWLKTPVRTRKTLGVRLNLPATTQKTPRGTLKMPAHSQKQPAGNQNKPVETTTSRPKSGNFPEASPRGEKYRPFKKVDGIDADFVALDLTSETQILLENLPAKSTLRVKLIASTDAGDSPDGDVAEITLS
jgi:hypothetical protein